MKGRQFWKTSLNNVLQISNVRHCVCFYPLVTSLFKNWMLQFLYTWKIVFSEFLFEIERHFSRRSLKVEKLFDRRLR